MEDINMLYQAVIFGCYEEISPKADTLKYFIDKFEDKQLIPSTFQELRLNGAIIKRTRFISSSGVWSIDFGSNRVDVKKINKDIGVIDMGTLSQFISEAKSIFKAINDKFPHKHNRLALATRHLLEPMDSKCMTKIYNNLNNNIDLYKKNEVVDWNIRSVVRSPYLVGDTKELFNVISQVRRRKLRLIIDSKKKTEDRIELSFDINTCQGNQDYRFDLELVDFFLDNALKIETDLKSNYLELIQ